MMKKFALLVFVAGVTCPRSAVASFEGMEVVVQGKKAEVNRFAGNPSGAGKAAKLSPEARAQAATVDAALQRAFVIERHARHLAEAGAAYQGKVAGAPPEIAAHQWARGKWVASADAPFIPIRRELQAAREAVATFDFSGKLPKKADALIRAYKASKADKVLLYRASLTYLTARSVDYTYDVGSMTGWRMGILYAGWEDIGSPQSYEFSRVGYGVIAGFPRDTDLMPLADRLLEKDPVDDLVVPCFVMDVYNGNHGRVRYDQALQLAKRYQAKHPKWAAPFALISTAYAARWMKFRAKDDIRRAIQDYDIYLSKVPKDLPSLPGLRQWRAILVKWQKAGKPI